MPLRVAIQMDPIESVNIEGDSSFVMGLSAEARGHKLWHYHPRQLTLRDGKAIARARPMSLRRKKGDHFTLGDEEVIKSCHAHDVTESIMVCGWVEESHRAVAIPAHSSRRLTGAASN